MPGRAQLYFASLVRVGRSQALPANNGAAMMGWVLHERVQRSNVNPKNGRDSAITPSQFSTTSANNSKAG